MSYTENERRTLEAVLFMSDKHYHYKPCFNLDGTISLYYYNFLKARDSVCKFNPNAWEFVFKAWSYHDFISRYIDQVYEDDSEAYNDTIKEAIYWKFDDDFTYADSPEEFIQNCHYLNGWQLVKDNCLYIMGYSYNQETGEGVLFPQFEFTDYEDFRNKFIDWEFEYYKDDYVNQEKDTVFYSMIEEDLSRGKYSSHI